MAEEFQALSLTTYAERGAVMNEYLRLFKELWTKDDPEFHGKYYQVSGIGFQPKPMQKPHPPIWIGGHSGPALRRAAILGDGWMPIGLRPRRCSNRQTWPTKSRTCARSCGKPGAPRTPSPFR
jgi:alkanesulfonate monooxygenase SsuD/methylene tetrahydromethanopterin reductase-like flavin-dependent oxidoreductase (luciferase family)